MFFGESVKHHSNSTASADQMDNSAIYHDRNDDIAEFKSHFPSLNSDDINDSLRSNTILSDGNFIMQSEKVYCGIISEKFLNVLLVSVGFMCNVGALQTGLMAQTVVLNSVQDDYFVGTPTLGYQLLAINCAAQAVAYLFGSSVCAVIGSKSALVLGSVCVSLYIACLLRPLMLTLYIGSVVVGYGLGTMWCVQGYFIFINSKPGLVERNMAIFWGFLQCSLIAGNLFYYLMLRGSETIEVRTRLIIFITLLACSIIGIFAFSLIAHPWIATDKHSNTKLVLLDGRKQHGASFKIALSATLKLCKRKEVLLLIPYFCFIGMECTFWSSIYSTSLGYTQLFGILRQSLVGLNGVFFGIGEISACIILSLLGKWSFRNGRDIFLILGLLVSVVGYYLIFLNLPPESPLFLTDKESYIGPNPYLAMFCTFLLGIADAVWTNQLMSYLSCTFPYDCIAVFGVYQLFCAIINSASFWYSTVLTLPWQLLILTLTAVPAAAGFCLAEWKSNQQSESIPNLN